ncbi:MAG: M23 family metallopeptidase [Chloroflexi bacterium]|nr:MAG: M23 family metallopeptidase [Chloroflexota bacterium]
MWRLCWFILLPMLLVTDTQAERPPLLPDSRFVYGPDAITFDMAAFIESKAGYLRQAGATVVINGDDGQPRQHTEAAAQVVLRVARDYSIDPRLLLALLDYQAGWLSQSRISNEARLYTFIADENYRGLYAQLKWAANELNRGFYGYRFRNMRAFTLADGAEINAHDAPNAATVTLWRFFGLLYGETQWEIATGENGFIATYQALFGDPFDAPPLSPLPEGLQQPYLRLPFARGEVWRLTGGPHGSWGDGSAWGALDFAPPDAGLDARPPCFTSDYPVRAVTNGIISRSGDGVVILDLDGDGIEHTGWAILYLHIAEQGRIEDGQTVEAGDIIGYPACAGGSSAATHLHIARRYNGVWLPAYCHGCTARTMTPQFVLSGWWAAGYEGQVYQGYLYRGERRVEAIEGRHTQENEISW